jgi:hypothetical protein
MKILLISLCFLILTAHASDLETLAQKSKWKLTGPASEAVRLCYLYQKKFPQEVKCGVYGKTPEGRDLVYLQIGKLKNPVVWVQAGIHAGEIDGKDAVFWLLREVFEKKIPNPFKNISMLFIPMVNPDGHERRGKWNRPNQVGPEEMGWRVTAQNYNLNRDFMKADAPEMKGLLKLWHKIDPILSLDLHVTDGAQFQPEVGLIILPMNNYGKSSLHQAGHEFEVSLIEKMKSRGRKALPFYPSFEEDDQPLSGFARYVSLPRFAHGYWSSNNRLGMLVETHSWKSYANRVLTHRDTVLSSLEIASTEALNWKKAEETADAEKLASQNVDLEFKHTEKSETIDFAGYKFKTEKSKISGGEVVRYFPDQPETWKVPYYHELISALLVKAPAEGYYIAAADALWVLPKLKLHGISYEKLKSPPGKVFSFRATKVEFSPKPFEGHQTLKVVGEWKEDKPYLPSGSYFVSIHQPRALLLLKLLEPASQDSLLAWGFFNRYFEQKEYMESYVTEDVAKEMLKVPTILEEFENKLKKDQEFLKSPEARFDYFYRKHPSWDDHAFRYPVFKK